MSMNLSVSRSRFACLFILSLAFAVVNDAQAVAQTAGKHTAKKSRHAKVHKIVKHAEEGEFANFGQWKEVRQFIDFMVTEHGFNKADLEATLRKARYIETAIQLIKPAPPGKPKNWQAYRDRFVEPVRLNAGLAFWNQYEEALTRAENQYGVPAGIIVALIGVETIYGRNTGNFRVMDAITTLAFAYPDTPTRIARMEYFRQELENTLLFAREENIDPFSLLGSYAGAIGWPQFMPSSIRKFAVDFDQDGKIDLRGSPVDAIGSVAHFLVEHGWKRDEPVVFPARVFSTTNLIASDATKAPPTVGPSSTGSSAASASTPIAPVTIAPTGDLLYATPSRVLPNDATSTPTASAGPLTAAMPEAVVPANTDHPIESWEKFIGQGLTAKFTLEELKAGGVEPYMGTPPHVLYSVVDLQNGLEPTEYWLGAENFFAITKYNRSYFYAMSIVALSNALQAVRAQ
jgi:membrane-bound lytic murein transglycosylase B